MCVCVCLLFFLNKSFYLHKTFFKTQREEYIFSTHSIYIRGMEVKFLTKAKFLQESRPISSKLPHKKQYT